MQFALTEGRFRRRSRALESSLSAGARRMFPHPLRISRHVGILPSWNSALALGPTLHFLSVVQRCVVHVAGQRRVTCPSAAEMCGR